MQKTGCSDLGLLQITVYSLCDTDAETINHLFFGCSYTSFIWISLKIKLDMLPDITLTLEDEVNNLLVAFQLENIKTLLQIITIVTCFKLNIHGYLFKFSESQNN